MVKLDIDGYPTEEFLERIRTWELPVKESAQRLLRFIEDGGWYYPEWFRAVDWNDRIWIVSTGGWSGNEDVIAALHENTSFFWNFCFMSHRRGGHYMFETEVRRRSSGANEKET